MSLATNSNAGHRATVTTTARVGLGCRAAILNPVASTHGPTRRLDRKYPVAAGFFDAGQVDTRQLRRDLARVRKSSRPGNTPTTTPVDTRPGRATFATLACHAGVAFFLRTHGAPA